jgi:hypothetical protein
MLRSPIVKLSVYSKSLMIYVMMLRSVYIKEAAKMAKKVRDLMPKQKEPEAGSLVKDLVSKAMGKSGKVKAIKLKIKFGAGEKSDKPKKRTVSHNPATHHEV